MTQAEAQALREEHGGVKAAARAVGMAATTFRRRLSGEGCGMDEKPKPQKQTTGMSGISLSGTRTSTVKPQASCKQRLYELERGKAYLLQDASREWGVRADTIKQHAKELDAFLYVEVTPENWQPAVIRAKERR